MAFHIYLLTIDHSEMTSDIRWFVISIFAIIAKALVYANVDMNFHL